MSSEMVRHYTYSQSPLRKSLRSGDHAVRVARPARLEGHWNTFVVLPVEDEWMAGDDAIRVARAAGLICDGY